jgi:hypothetical protein
LKPAPVFLSFHAEFEHHCEGSEQPPKNDDVLKLHIAKSEAARPKQIEVKIS